MSPARLTVATAQFAVSADPAWNAGRMVALMEDAAMSGAEVVHFPEAALSGYAGAHFASWSGYDWPALEAAHGRIAAACRRLGVWAVYGASHAWSGEPLPANAVFVVDVEGEPVGRYDKRCCSAREATHYRRGKAPLVVEIGGVRCGILICLEWSFPALWQAYAEAGVELIFLSAHAAGLSGGHLHNDVIPPTLQGHAFTNCLFVSASNASNPRQAFASHWVKRSGRRGAACRRHRAGFVVNSIADDAEKEAFYRRVRAFRAAALKAALSGT